MTGELFALLSQKSILKNAVEKGMHPHPDSFKQGLQDGASTNLLNAFFKVRTRQLFEICDKNENYNYLSGVLIGAELKELVEIEADVINLVSGDELGDYYFFAMSELLPHKDIRAFSNEQAGNASVMGQIKIGRQLQLLA
jgi:2-dehydro-3-deoxygalactonokinase